MTETIRYTTYHVWFIAQRDAFAEALAAKLVRRGFTVGPLGRHFITSHEDNPACVVALSLYRAPRTEAERKEYNARGVHQEVTDVMKHVKGKFWAVVVSASADSTWNIGNESISEQERAKEEAKKQVN